MTRLLLPLAASTALLALASCISTTPTAEELDGYEKAVRAQYQSDYAMLEQQRQAGMSNEEYQARRSQLDQRVQNQVDTMAWNRHALAQSELKANSIPTPDKPVANPPPGVGSIPNSLYNTARTSIMGQQNMPTAGSMGSSRMQY